MVDKTHWNYLQHNEKYKIGEYKFLHLLEDIDLHSCAAMAS